MFIRPMAFFVTIPLCCQFACGGPVPELPAPPADMAPAAVPPLRCELPYDVRALDKVATGIVEIQPSPTEPEVYNAQIDATAGGMAEQSKNPFVYLDLVQRKKVEITDVQAQHSTDWDIAFKRWQIKMNSGDSGPGYVLMTRVPALNLAEVTQAPIGPYQVDAYFDAKCQLQSDPIGGLGSALSDWYEYDMTMTPNRLVPKKEVLVLTRRDGQGHIKLQLTGYYKGLTSAHYSLSWSNLP